jgi:hypothetical protein
MCGSVHGMYIETFWNILKLHMQSNSYFAVTCCNSVLRKKLQVLICRLCKKEIFAELKTLASDQWEQYLTSLFNPNAAAGEPKRVHRVHMRPQVNLGRGAFL